MGANIPGSSVPSDPASVFSVAKNGLFFDLCVAPRMSDSGEGVRKTDVLQSIKVRRRNLGQSNVFGLKVGGAKESLRRGRLNSEEAARFLGENLVMTLDAIELRHFGVAVAVLRHQIVDFTHARLDRQQGRKIFGADKGKTEIRDQGARETRLVVARLPMDDAGSDAFFDFMAKKSRLRPQHHARATPKDQLADNLVTAREKKPEGDVDDGDILFICHTASI